MSKKEEQEYRSDVSNLLKDSLDNDITKMAMGTSLKNAGFFDAVAEGFTSEAKSNAAKKSAESEAVILALQEQTEIQKAQTAKVIAGLVPVVRIIKGTSFTRTAKEWKDMEDNLLKKLPLNELLGLPPNP